ncbi:2-methylaconitate cis-trans isomerase PrpF [Shewanella intestini]|uniref:2-methylaconitate cis-trans isomerase PrpF n=1 Tax=Shewanella intestini TaxID=2017544 RepID=A0ABS5HZL4_9GAMM|nr:MULTISPECIES: 2-methylaconitate cis-trans isomerase PrpF [Shewanella]MBR9727238.1 2-methylaconitate cis-trans isomerase PrpF [Shewanella intestini]MRG36040.1 2-methylaconitate cis-trans isomerase PrpF [Shewanella sp. XMDDZSB0408]
MSFKPQLKIPATYMRGGTSKGVFFALTDLPNEAQQAGAARDALLLRIIGSPDPYAKQTDGMGGATSSTSKTVIVSKSTQVDHDVDYLFGQVAIDKPFIDWSGNCGNLTAAVGAFAISHGLVSASRIPDNGIAIVRIWQANINKTIIAHIPMHNGEVQETGDFELDGVTFPAAEVLVEFMAPADKNAAMFPTGNVVDDLLLPESVSEFAQRGLSSIRATMINAGIPTIFVNAVDIGFTGKELQDAINNDATTLAFFEQLRAHGAVKMGLINHIDEAKARQHTPKIAFVAPPVDYVASSGKSIKADEIDLQVRALSMGKLHHAMMGTAAVAIAVAAAVEGSLVNIAAGGKPRSQVVFGHPSGTLKVGAKASFTQGNWQVEKASMSRSARVLMEGHIRVPETR